MNLREPALTCPRCRDDEIGEIPERREGVVAWFHCNACGQKWKQRYERRARPRTQTHPGDPANRNSVRRITT
jgi:transposase-like protein